MLFSCSAGILHGVVCFLVQEEQVWWSNPIEAMKAAANDLRWTPAVSFRVGCCLCVCVWMCSSMHHVQSYHVSLFREVAGGSLKCLQKNRVIAVVCVCVCRQPA